MRPRATAAAPLRPSPATTGQHSQNHLGVVRIVIDTKRVSLFQHEQTFGERYASDATTAGTLQASAFSVQRRITVSDPLRCTLHTEHCPPAQTQTNACKRCKEATQANKSRPTLRGKHRIPENSLANWATAVRGVRSFSGNGGGRGGGRGHWTAAEHSRRGSSTVHVLSGGSTPRHLPHRPCRFAAHR